MKIRQSKGNNSAIPDDSPIKLHMHNLIVVINIQNKIPEFYPLGYLVMDEDRKKSLKFRKPKGNFSAITDDTLIKLHMHNLALVIYIQYKFQEIPSIGYLVMAEDGKNH